MKYGHRCTDRNGRRHPLATAAILIALTALTIWLLPRLGRGARHVINTARGLLGHGV